MVGIALATRWLLRPCKLESRHPLGVYCHQMLRCFRMLGTLGRPPSLSPLTDALDAKTAHGLAPILTAFADARSPLVITGAGISTSSGIPDYRSPNRPTYTPLNHNDFISKPNTRRRYWARSFLGFHRMNDTEPNEGHIALARLLVAGRVTVITQNVDRLHHRAVTSVLASHGSVVPSAVVPPIIELHGTIFEVACLDCGWETSRESTQDALVSSNAAWRDRWLRAASSRPDGDVELPEESYSEFAMPRCGACGGDHLKPKVVFFGGTLDPEVRAAAAEAAAAADFVLLAGTTVTTFSAFRLARDAARRGVPVAIINYGPTRADELLAGPQWKIEGHTSPCLSLIAGTVLDQRQPTR